MQSAKLQRFGSCKIRELNNGTCKLLVFFVVFIQCSCAFSLDNQASDGPVSHCSMSVSEFVHSDVTNLQFHSTVACKADAGIHSPRCPILTSCYWNLHSSCSKWIVCQPSNHPPDVTLSIIRMANKWPVEQANFENGDNNQQSTTTNNNKLTQEIQSSIWQFEWSIWLCFLKVFKATTSSGLTMLTSCPQSLLMHPFVQSSLHSENCAVKLLVTHHLPSVLLKLALGS